MTNIELDSRKAFEEWADNEGIDLDLKGGFHELAAINAWSGWQACAAYLTALNSGDGSLKNKIKELTDEQRSELFADYCRCCGCNDSGCQCWNDE